MSGALGYLLAVDNNIGERIHRVASASPVQRLAATAFSLGVDEAFWFTIPLLTALTCYLIEQNLLPFSLVSAATANEYRLFALEVFNDAIMVTGGGAMLKLACRRARPAYATQPDYHITNGDRFSFPSGHAFFAAVMFQRFVHSSLAALLGVVCVSWSRAAKGRHYPLDTVCGAALGTFVGRWSLGDVANGQSELFGYGWSRLKLLVAFAQFGEVVLATVVPAYQTPGYAAGSWFLALAFALLPPSHGLSQHVLILIALVLAVCPPLGWARRRDDSRSGKPVRKESIPGPSFKFD